MISLKKIVLIPLFLFISCDVQINKDFNIPDNTKVKKDLITVNGDINIGKNCIVGGDLNTVNGVIKIQELSHVKAYVQAVTGSIIIEENVTIEGDISTMTGTIEINSSSVLGNVSNISGDIEFSQTNLTGDLISNFGNITLTNNTVIDGSIIIKENEEIPEKLRNVKVVIADSSVVQGDLINDNREVIVVVYVEEGSSISGEIIDADVVESLKDLEND